MLASLIIVFREVLEAGLIVGIVLAATQGVAGRGRWIGIGIGGGIAGACTVAVFADAIASQFSGDGQELFNAGVLLIAVAMLAWHNIWMAQHGRELAGEMKSVGQAVSTGERPLYALAVVVGLAVLREGSEVVLFLAGIAAADDSGAVALATGGAAGVVLGVAVALLLYAGLLRIPARYLFSVTTWLITLVTAGMAAGAAGYLTQAGVLSVGGETVWDTSWLLRDDTLLGKTLHVLVGYTDRPTFAQITAYVLVVAAITGLTRLSHRPPPPRLGAMQGNAAE